MSSIFKIDPNERKAIITETSMQVGLPFEIVEKDLWVCWLLHAIFKLPEKIAFKGGTSLGKLGLINRFSEDCDITVDYKNFIPDINFNASKSQLKKDSINLKKCLREYLKTKVIPILNSCLQKEIAEPEKYSFVLSEDKEDLQFNYKAQSSNNYLLDHVLIEFGTRNTTEPSEEIKIKPYISELLQTSVTLPETTINILSPIRTFWEKATLIHVECNRERLNSNDAYRLSRHWYDLYKLYMSTVGNKAINDLLTFHNVLKIKKAFYNSSVSNYDACLQGKFSLIPTGEGLLNLKKDFIAMDRAGMFREEKISFDHILKKLKILEETLNEKCFIR